MKRSSKLMLFGLGLFLIAVVVAPPHSHSSSNLGVTVMNTPLPVQGTVGVNNFPANQTVNGTISVGNTPTVNVGSLPAVQLTGGNVNATVINPTDTNGPIPLVTLDGVAHTGFLNTNGCLFMGTTNDCITHLVFIPANQVAVIESFSGACFLDQGSAVLQLSLTPNKTFGPYLFVSPGTPVPSAGIPVPGMQLFEFGQDIKGYFPGGSGGTTLNAYINTTTLQNTTGQEGCEFNVAGHLDPQ